MNLGGSASSSEQIARAYAACAEITRTRARNFYYGLRLTPEPRRSAIYSVYAWMRRADDEADAAAEPASKLARLAEFRATAERMIAGHALDGAEHEPVWIAFRETVRRYGVDPRDLRDMLNGLEADLSHELRAAGRADGPNMICRSRDDLERYCYQVASTVGLVCITIWGLNAGMDRERARSLAIQRGLAFQLTNILRDYAQDFDEGRVYLPQQDFSAGRVNPVQLREWSKPEECEALIADLAGWARRQYQESQALDRMIDPCCYAALRTMTRIYSGLLGVIEHDPARIVGQRRIRLQSLHKAGIAARACARAWVNAHVSESSRLYAMLTPAGRR